VISVEDFSKKLCEAGFDQVIGVPDSTFKGLISYFSSQDMFRHTVAVNECEAVAIAAGYYLGQGKPAVVYMQNSGFCKTLNPYTSLLSADVYSLPALMLVGWRGEPGKKDEPQHKMMGRIMLDLMRVMEIDYAVLDEALWPEQVQQACAYVREKERPFIMVIKPEVFADFKISRKKHDYEMTREEVLRVIVENASDQAMFISTTGKTSRELFEIREQRQESHGKDFYTVGSMGCASAIGFGLGLASSRRPIFILDGDGASLMQLGSLATIGHYTNRRIKHIIIDNGAHESTGNQPTVSDSVNFLEIGQACGYEWTACVETRQELNEAVFDLEKNNRLSLLVVKVKPGSRPDLGRPTTTPRENRDAFMAHFRQ